MAGMICYCCKKKCVPACPSSPSNTEPPYYPPYAIGVDGISFCIKSIDIANDDAFGDELYFSVVLDDGPFFTKAKKDAGDGGTLDPFVKVGVLNVQPDNDTTDIIATVDINARFIISDAGGKYQLIATAVYEGATYVLFNTDIIDAGTFTSDPRPILTTLTDILNTAVGGTDEGGAIGANAVIKEIVCLMNGPVVGFLMKFQGITLNTAAAGLSTLNTNDADGVTIPLIGAPRYVFDASGTGFWLTSDPAGPNQGNGQHSGGFGSLGLYLTPFLSYLRSDSAVVSSWDGNVSLQASADSCFIVQVGFYSLAGSTIAYRTRLDVGGGFLQAGLGGYNSASGVITNLFGHGDGVSVIGPTVVNNDFNSASFTGGYGGNVTITPICSTMKIDGADDTTGLATPASFSAAGGTGNISIVSSDGGPFQDWYAAVTQPRQNTAVTDGTYGGSPGTVANGTLKYIDAAPFPQPPTEKWPIDGTTSEGPDPTLTFLNPNMANSSSPGGYLLGSVLWAHITSATSGTGNATLSYSVDANTWGAKRQLHLRLNCNYAIQIIQSAT